MLKSHDKFHSTNGKRLIMVVDDEAVNRAILGAVLQDEYEVIYASDGREALEKMHEFRDLLSLVLLDLYMPVMSGLDLLKETREDPGVSQIPIIVVTSDQESEIDSLKLGASDFIPKPYPQAGVIQARVLKTIELYEDRQIINSTERDPLTGLYNREYFYRYAEQFDQHHKNMKMDAVVVDINHFHMINERFGTEYGDSVLRRIGEKMRELVQDSQGIVCRREADTFMIYCPHGKDYRVILEKASVGLSGDNSVNNRVRLRMGIYENVDKSMDIERRFDRAKMAADTVRSSFSKAIGIYDDTMHEKELYVEQLLEDFHAAIAEHQFKVFYQPKFDVRFDEPFLSSAEALVRWQHPKLGMISPGVFIPLFEDNGLIQELDHYVWKEAAAQMKDWHTRLGISVPVSVNVSRIDMYDPNLLERMRGIIAENDLDVSELLLEITESAYTQDSEQIIETVNMLRAEGFRIEMDDFGTGYSSLNMISTLPIDALKLDMQFIQNAFDRQKDTRMLEVIIEIADYLAVPVIAEGVETEDQMKSLKAMGCDLVQGYYFSRPVPADEYEHFLVERSRQKPDFEQISSFRSAKRKTDSPLIPSEGHAGEANRSEKKMLGEARRSIVTFSSIAQALSQDYFSIYYIDIETDAFIEYSSHSDYQNLGIEKSGNDFFNLSRKNILRVVYPEDHEMILGSFTKENIMRELGNNPTFTLTYRLMFENQPTYVHMKATRMKDRNDPHIVIGVSNVDEQIRREQEHAKAIRLANQDALTGVKSKYAYDTAERNISFEISGGKSEPFAVAVCDINGLKEINDTLGHHAGDDYIKKACRSICTIFKHSPVYRIGGDEFVAILRGGDYDMRDDLMLQLDELNEKRSAAGDVIIAGGLADYLPGQDTSLASVFERADTQMYLKKKQLKDNC